MRWSHIAGITLSVGVLVGIATPPDHALAANPAASGLFRGGRYEQALTAAARPARELARAQPGSARFHAALGAVVWAARAELALGRLAAARIRLEQAAVQAPAHLPLRAALAQVAYAQGDLPAVAALVRLTRRHFPRGDGEPEPAGAAELVAIAALARHGNAYQAANALLRAAVKAAPRDPAANIAWGFLFLEKHAASEALRCFDQALALVPDHPDALVGKAHALLERSDRDGARAALADAQRINPRHAGAGELLGELALDDEDFPAVERAVVKLRAIDPASPEAAWLAGALGRLREPDAPPGGGVPSGYVRIRDAHLRAHPGDADFFASVAQALTRQRRYQDARAVAAECTDSGGESAPPEDLGRARCLSVLGTTLLRLGDEKNGLAALRAAWKRDPFDTRIFNQLELFETTIARDYTIVTSPHFRFRVLPSMRPAIETAIAPFLEGVYRQYAARYRHEPPTPITIELYRDPAHFAIRTVGLPGLGVSAVCFGPVITSQAPTNGRMNWAMVLAHELAHSFALSLSRERVPRWFTEGLSELETTRLHPDFIRHDHLTLWAALRRGRVPRLANLSLAFVSASSPDDAVTAYMAAAQALMFLERRHGWDAILKALAGFARGAGANQVLDEMTAREPMPVDDAFRAELAQRYQPFERQFLPRSTERLPQAEAERRAARPGAPADDLARAGLAALLAGSTASARRWLLGASIKSAPAPSPLVRYLEALLDEKDGDPDGVIAALSPLVNGQHDGYDLRVRLGLAALRKHDAPLALTHLRVAVALGPEEVEGWIFLAKAAESAGQAEEKLAAQERAFRLDPQSGPRGKQILVELARTGRNERAASFATLVAFADPGDAEVQVLHAEALRGLGRTAEAVAAFERALALGAVDPAAIKHTLANLLDELGEHARAARTRGRRPSR